MSFRLTQCIPPPHPISHADIITPACAALLGGLRAWVQSATCLSLGNQEDKITVDVTMENRTKNTEICQSHKIWKRYIEKQKHIQRPFRFTEFGLWQGVAYEWSIENEGSLFHAKILSLLLYTNSCYWTVLSQSDKIKGLDLKVGDQPFISLLSLRWG